ncbi:MAG: hypothetical protein Q9182_000146 [Xanthomendoza sp. 2 TL-2023]
MEKFSKAIKYWETSEEEYESLREVLQSLGDDASTSAIKEVAGQSTGEVLNEKEINILLRDERSGPRTTQQIVGLLSRRIEYVRSNITSLRSQLQAAGGSSTASQPFDQARHDDEADYPLMEIQEQLDEDDNVISSSITPASVAAPQVVEALRKAGINGPPVLQQDNDPPHQVESGSSDEKTVKDSKTTSPILKQTSRSPPRHRRDQQPSPSTSESDSKGDDCKAARRRKSVTFADGTKQAPPTPTEPRSAKDVQAAKRASIARRIKAEVRGSIDALKKVHNAGFISDEVFDRFRQEYVERLQSLPSTIAKHPNVAPQTPSDQKDRLNGQAPTVTEYSPTIPTDESPEDAALRREMIRYNQNEVGAVVAEMHLDDDEQSDRWDSVDSNDESQHRTSSDEDEDRWGMNTNSRLSRDYIEEMQALEQKLNAKSTQNIGSGADIATILQAEKDLEVGQDGNPVKKTVASIDQSRKAVRFAHAPRVQERPLSPKSESPSQPREKQVSAPVHTDIVERGIPTSYSPITIPSASKKNASRFKNSLAPDPRAAANTQHPSPLQMQTSNGNQIKTPSLPGFTPPATPKITPMGPPGRIQAPNVIERPHSDMSNQDSVSEPSEFDPSLLQQELMMDYHRSRNRMIQRQGGFLADEEEQEREATEGPLVDENGKKISRFKAARLKAVSG